MVKSATVFYPDRNEKTFSIGETLEGCEKSKAWVIDSIQNQGATLVVRYASKNNKPADKQHKFKEIVTFGIPFMVFNDTKSKVIHPKKVKKVTSKNIAATFNALAKAAKPPKR